MLLHAGAAQAGPAGRDPATAAALSTSCSMRGGPRSTTCTGCSGCSATTAGPTTPRPAPWPTSSGWRRRAGAALTVEGSPRTVPAALEATAYRVVQEALTNARKHAPGAAVRVRLRWTDTALEVEVTDDGARRPAPPPGPASVCSACASGWRSSTAG